ncbi:MAG: acetyl-CoA carboxylase biotin carboxylase subunit [Alphaproteobacteria bacterium]|nr:acetyl-CoA carboxylase biotin carboxylase subunit [Alphaproteobacteria bacterium]MBN2779635.1 acetyl-CoA carboxylase biotin carboxylase subunit [Alphaproteobacteria bacterium]
MAINKILIANRGEIAVRVMKACRELGIKTVAVYSTMDKDSLHVKLADQAICIGPAPSAKSYLNTTAIMTAALMTGADAIHPGYGFLSENANFVEMIEDHGLKFIGPSSKLIRKMGDKVEAKLTAISVGIPTVPGSKGAVESVQEAKELAEKIGFPVVIKAASGGGGRGINRVNSMDEMEAAFVSSRLEAKSYFADPTVYMEKFLTNPKHIEIQVLGDEHGNAVALGARDCSVQRNNQKIIEECDAAILTPEVRKHILNVAQQATAKIGYSNAGTIEFLYENGEFYFMEMNTRLQVEHPVTEEVYGVDLVKEQIRVANGEKLGYTQADVKANGAAIECRINAEDPKTFVPNAGLVTDFVVPSGPGIRVDSFLYDGYKVPPTYDSMIAKLIVHGKDRADAISKAKKALDGLEVKGIKTNIPLHKAILNDPEFVEGKFTINWLSGFLKTFGN